MIDLRVWPAILWAALLAGCMVGPKYRQPPAPMTPAYKEPPPDAFKETDQWKTAKPMAAALRGNWWEIFGDPQLNGLEAQVTTGNLNLKAAEARYREARTMVRYNRAALFPSISTAPNISTLRDSPNSPYFPIGSRGIGSTAEYLLPFDVSYEVDLWGRIRRTVAAAGEEAQATSDDLQTLRLSLHAELAIDYFELRSADAQIRLLADTVRRYTELAQLTTELFRGGAAAESDVVQAQTQLDTARVQYTDVFVSRAQYEHALAILMGKPPAEFSLPAAPLAARPPAIPVGVPSQLLERRPDIAASERRVAEANEQIGIARAAYFPSLLLGAAGGLEGNAITNWLIWPSRFWAVGPTLAETLFDAGRRRATSDAARANYDATVAAYRETVLAAFQEVEDNLSTLRVLEQEAQQENEAVAEAKRGVELFTYRYKGGADPYLQVLVAQTIELLNERNAIDILRRRMEASVLLIKGLGGGWDASTTPSIRSMH
ncbi:MAG TPA: efflux transporter outer membrane subunit [Bryobacteraceae bacterium]|nr:efflux transporter outer membrane subunit [Bryobacteraceae bacterium]